MNICVIGGDPRIVELVKILEKHKNKICLYGLEKSEDLSKFEYINNKNTNYDNTNSDNTDNYNIINNHINNYHTDNLEYAIQNSELIITSIPLSKDGEFVNSIFSEKKIAIKDIFEIAKNKKIITGNITDEIKQYIKQENNNEIIDILKFEELTILNAIPTAEGAIQIAMEKSLKTVHGSKCLVLGFGRIGKILAKMLLGIGAEVYCEARKESDIAWIKSYGYNEIHLNDLSNYLGEFDFIFNTIPYLILDKSNLNLVKKDCILIDLASKPGGIDFDEADRLQLQTVWALALPGKVAPQTVASYIYNIIKKL